MLFSPSEWYEHYAAFAAPFLVVLVALSAARPVRAGRQVELAKPEEPAGPTSPRPRTAEARKARARTSLDPGGARGGRRCSRRSVAAMGAADGYAVTKLYPARDLSAASALIPPGACVLTDTASVTIVIDRFSAAHPAARPWSTPWAR